MDGQSHHTLISIIIPMYNASAYIEECISSVFVQTLNEGVECIIVDDCSPDNSATLAEALIATYKGDIKFQIIHHENNKGVSAARNTGIKVSKGEYIFFIDSDDIISYDCLEQLYSMARKYPNVDIVQGNTYCIGPIANALRLDRHPEIPEYSHDARWLRSMMLMSKIPPIVWNKLISRKFLIDNNLYLDENITTDEDNLWLFFASKHVSVMAFCRVLTYNYRTNDNGLTANRMVDDKYKSNFYTVVNEMYYNLDKHAIQMEFALILKYSYMIEPRGEANIQYFKHTPIYQYHAFHRLYHYYCQANVISRKRIKGLYVYVMYRIYLVHIIRNI